MAGKDLTVLKGFRYLAVGLCLVGSMGGSLANLRTEHRPDHLALLVAATARADGQALKTAGNDVDDLARILRDRGWRVTVLRSGKAIDIKRALAQLARETRTSWQASIPAPVALVWLSGFGDYRQGMDWFWLDGTGQAGEGIAIREVARRMQAVAAPYDIALVVDASRTANPRPGERLAAGTLNRPPCGALAFGARRAVSVFSTLPGMAAYDQLSPEDRNGLFFSAFRDALAARPDGSFMGVLSTAARTVLTRSLALGGGAPRQEPVYCTWGGFDDFEFDGPHDAR